MKYMLPGKTVLDYTNLFSPNDYKNDRMIYRYFKKENTGLGFKPKKHKKRNYL